METRVHELEDGIFCLSTRSSAATRTVNQFLIDADEPLLFHAGTRSMFATAATALARIMPVDRLRWLSFSHVEADELGAMNLWLAHAAHLEVLHTPLGCATSIADLADRPPVAHGPDARELGGRRVRLVSTPDLPHNPEAVMLFEEVTATLCCSDLGSNDASGPVIDEPVLGIEPARAPFPAVTAVTVQTPDLLRRLAALRPRMLAVMHGASFYGDPTDALTRFAADCEAHLESARR